MGYLFMYYMAECWPVKPKGKVLTKVYQKIGIETIYLHYVVLLNKLSSRMKNTYIAKSIPCYLVAKVLNFFLVGPLFVLFQPLCIRLYCRAAWFFSLELELNFKSMHETRESQ